MTTSVSSRPWADIDPVIATALRPSLPRLVEQTLEQIAGELPALGSDLAGPYGEALRLGVEQALEHFLSLLGADLPALDARLTRLYEGFGAREHKHGRSLDTLLAAYRRGARGAWAHFSAAAVDAKVETDQLVRLAEAIFAYIEELSSASTLGYAREFSLRAGQRDVLRQQLAEWLLKGGAETEAAQVAELAAEVGWPVPERVAAAVLPLMSNGSSRRLPLLPAEVLVAVMGSEALAVVPGDSLRRGTSPLAAATAGGSVFVGSIRPPEEAPVSLAHARALERLVADGVIRAGGAVALAGDHLPELLLHADRRLLADLTARALAPLDAVSPARRDILAATLRVWLSVQGDRLAAARVLGVHPQTVTYRMARVDELFGDALAQPRGRFAITLALEGLPR